jgi:hypothetical protein
MPPYLDNRFIMDSESDNDIEYNSDNDDDEYDSIYQEEELFIDSEKSEGQYIIGLTNKCNHTFGDIYSSGVTAKTLFKFSFQNIVRYLYLNSISLIRNNQRVEIVKIHIDENKTYIALKKTYWLRLVQRHWKKLCIQKNDIVKKRMRISSLHHREISGKWPLDCLNFPNSRGILSQYAN